jgi:hypothetical protein
MAGITLACFLNLSRYLNASVLFENVVTKQGKEAAGCDDNGKRGNENFHIKNSF